jgi:single-strand DNA-binding protein
MKLQKGVNMNNSAIQIVGNVATEIRFNTTPEGIPVASFRLAATERRFDKSTSRWIDGEVNWYTISCWRAMAENVAASVQKGDPLYVYGRLNVRTWERDDRSGTTLEVTAEILGHDLGRGTSTFSRMNKAVSDEISTAAA